MAVTKTSLYFASELGMLTWLLDRNNLEDSETEICCLDTNTLYSIPLGDPKDVTSTTYTSRSPSKKTYNDNRNDSFRHQGSTTAQDYYETSHAPLRLEAPRGYASVAGAAGARDRVFYDERSLISMFPCLRGRMEFIHAQSSILEGSGAIVIPAVMYGVSQPFPHVKTLYGAVTDKDGGEIYPDILASARGSTRVIDDFARWLPDEQKDMTKAYYPIFWQHIDSYKVRPTGEIIVQGRPVLSKDPELSIAGVELSSINWAKYACSKDYLEAQDDDQIASMWVDLAAGKIIFDDDVPF
jgi:hypothetical protein